MRKSKLFRLITLGMLLSSTAYGMGYAQNAINGGTVDLSGNVVFDTDYDWYINPLRDTTINLTGDTTITGDSPNKDIINPVYNSSLIIDGHGHDLTMNKNNDGQIIHYGARDNSVTIKDVNNFTTNSIASGYRIPLGNNSLKIQANNDISCTNTGSSSLFNTKNFDTTSHDRLEVNLIAGHDIKLSSTNANVILFDNDAKINVTADNDITVTGAGSSTPDIYLKNGAKATFKAKHDFNGTAQSYFVYAIDQSKIIVTADDDINLNTQKNGIVVKNGSSGTFNASHDFNLTAAETPIDVENDDSMLNVLARNDINIESTGSSAGVYFSGSTATGIFEAPEGNITMKSSNGNTASLSADDGASVRLYAAKDVTVGGDTQRAIRSRGDSTVDITSGWDNAIYLEATNTSGDNNAAIYTDDSGSVILHSNAVVNAVTNGVDANGGTVDFIKGLDMSGAATAINARNGGVVNASNEVSDKKITGNIFSDGTGSDVNVNFMTANSYFTGASAKSNGGTIDLALRNGGVWNVTGDSNLTTLTNNDNGIIDMTHTGNTMYETITTDDYQGNGGTIRMNTDLDSETNSDRLVITNGTTAANGYIQVYDKSLVDGSKVTGPKQLLLVQDNNGLTSWTGKSLDTGGVWNINPTVEQIGNDWYLVLGEGSVITPNTTAQTYFGFSDNAYGMWRSFLTDDTLRKRLGDLRYGAEDVSGVWARIKAGKLDASGYDADYQMYQGGYDKKSGNTAYGMAVNYMRSKLNYEAGYGHDTMNNMSLYATTYHDSGAYNDIVLSVGKYRSNVHVNPNDDYADYDAWAYSASYEVGKTYRQNHGWFVEPQGQLIYGHMQGTDSISNNGSAMHRDSINSFLGRAGVVLGRKVNDHSDYYLKANVYKEFAGDGDMCLDATDNYGTRQHITHSSDNKDTWFELGLGGNLKLSDNAYMYGDVLKTFGANINKKWQINLGLRWAIGSGVPKVVSQPVVEPAVEPVQPAPVVQEKQEAYYDSVHFGFDEDQPLTGEAAKVSRFAATAKAHPERTYAMVGNTDSVGTDAYNNDLSKRRVEHVKTLAEQQGVPAAQMQDSYLGKSHPVDTNETEQGRANNRRVDIYEHQ